LNITKDDKILFINDMKYLFNNNLLFIGNCIYDVKKDNSNKPPAAIKMMLYFKLQPFVNIYMNKYLIKYINTSTVNMPSIPSTENYDLQCYENNYGHAVNLRKWYKSGIEFKNSWGFFTSNDGNFSVENLKYLICNNNSQNKNILNFTSLMFDYNNLNKKFKTKVNRNLCLYFNTFDNTLEIDEFVNYTGNYNDYKLFDGYGKLIYSDGHVYDGHWKNGFREGCGIINYVNGDFFKGSWKNNNICNGDGRLTSVDNIIHIGKYKNGLRHGKGKLFKINENITIEGIWKNGEKIK
jgi:hypothetical protein